MSGKLDSKPMPAARVRRDFVRLRLLARVSSPGDGAFVAAGLQIAAASRRFPGSATTSITRSATSRSWSFAAPRTASGRSTTSAPPRTTLARRCPWNAEQVFCGYHAWTFDLDGKVNSIPDRDDWKGCPQFSEEDLSLSPVRVDTGRAGSGSTWTRTASRCTNSWPRYPGTRRP